ncbi:conserved hypothetical protein, partial [Streptomyces lividans TK24]
MRLRHGAWCLVPGAWCLRRLYRVAGGACGGLCGFGGGARCAVCPVGGSGSRRGVSVLGTARNRSATEANSVDAPTTAGGHPPTLPLLAVRGSPRQRSASSALAWPLPRRSG